MDETPVALPLVYLDLDEVPIFYANQFVMQHLQNEFVLTLGQVAPPLLLGTEEEQREQASHLDYVGVKVLGRFAFTRSRLTELIDVLTRNLAKYDEVQANEDGE